MSVGTCLEDSLGIPLRPRPVAGAALLQNNIGKHNCPMQSWPEEEPFFLYANSLPDRLKALSGR